LSLSHYVSQVPDDVLEVADTDLDVYIPIHASVLIRLFKGIESVYWSCLLHWPFLSEWWSTPV